MNRSTSAYRVATPWHVWVVGVLALVWNSIGALNYVMTQTRNASYMSQYTSEQLAYVDAVPSWVVATWALAVWGSLLGSILLLLRKRLAVLVFGVALAMLIVTTIHNFWLTDGLAVLGSEAAIFTAVIVAISVALLVYARHLARVGVLR